MVLATECKEKCLRTNKIQHCASISQVSNKIVSIVENNTFFFTFPLFKETIQNILLCKPKIATVGSIKTETQLAILVNTVNTQMASNTFP